MYSIRTTPGFIIDSRPYGEAGKMLSMFTRDLGLVVATAQGIRLEKSKLRYNAQEYSFGEFSLVRGKEFWRLTSAANGKIVAPEGRVASELIARIAMLLRRLLHGEEAHPELFDAVMTSVEFVCDPASPPSSLSGEQSKTLESLIVLRILHALGYIGNNDGMSDLVDNSRITLEILGDAAPKRAAMNQHINKALHESHL